MTRLSSSEAATGLKRSSGPAGGERARAVAERHRRHIARWFDPCSPAMHRSLGEMYVADRRFAATCEGREPGLAAYVRGAHVANAEAESSVSR